MNIQIFGKSKCFDTKKAERYFKERRIKYQYIDLNRYGISRGELQSVKTPWGLRISSTKSTRTRRCCAILPARTISSSAFWKTPRF